MTLLSDGITSREATNSGQHSDRKNGSDAIYAASISLQFFEDDCSRYMYLLCRLKILPWSIFCLDYGLVLGQELVAQAVSARAVKFDAFVPAAWQVRALRSAVPPICIVRRYRRCALLYPLNDAGWRVDGRGAGVQG